MQSYIYNFQIGSLPLSITQTDNKISGVFLSNNPLPQKLKNYNFVYKKTALLEIAIGQLSEYLSKTRQYFDLPLHIIGTEFEKKVYFSLLKTKYGCYKTYKDIAIEIGSKNAFRAVGRACNKNPLLILIPCHRCIGSNNSLTGFSAGLNLKKHLLQLENTKF